MNDYAGQHEVISENMTCQITAELARYVQELKQERKSVTTMCIYFLLSVVHDKLIFKMGD